MKKVIITDNQNYFEIQDKNIIDLEIKLNATDYGKTWSYIGDYLYNFYTDNSINRKSNILKVTEYQFSYLKYLNGKNYEEIYKENSH